MIRLAWRLFGRELRSGELRLLFVALLIAVAAVTAVGFVAERFRLALKGYGNTLLQSGDPCAAADQFTLSLQVGPDPEVDELLFKATTECQLGQAPTEAPSEGPAPTATPGGPLPTIEVPPATTPYPPPPAP